MLDKRHIEMEALGLVEAVLLMLTHVAGCWERQGGVYCRWDARER
jgi:hypothetical protein